MVPGVGKKTAARLLIELKSKIVGADFGDYDIAIAAASEASGTKAAERQAPDARNDVRSALTELGYGADEVRSVIRKLPSEGDSAALLKQALGILSGGN